MSALHDAVYEAIVDICHDREYVYPLFLRVFGQLTERIYGAGAVQDAGEVEANGIKSDDRAAFRWRLKRRVSFQGQNELSLDILVTDKHSGALRARRQMTFDVSTGECMDTRTLME